MSGKPLLNPGKKSTGWPVSFGSIYFQEVYTAH